MKKYLLFGLIIIFFAGFLYNISVQAAKTTGTHEEILLLEAVETGGFQTEEFNINISTYIPDKLLTIKEIENMREDMMKIFDVDKEITIIDRDDMNNPHSPNYLECLPDTEDEIILEQRTEDEGYNEVITFIPCEDGNMTVIKMLSTQIEERAETYIAVDITRNKGYKRVVGICNQIQEYLNKYENKVETAINITGAQQGRLGNAEEKQGQKAVFDFLKAKKVEVLEDEHLTSITAYSPLISSHISYGGKNVNIQLAMRYSEYEDKTYLWIATPLITVTY